MRSHRVSSPNGARDDVYYWLRDDTRSDPDVLSYLKAENQYTEAMLAPVQPLIDRLYTEIVARLKQDDSTVPVRYHGYWYAIRFATGQEYPIVVRWLDAPGAEEVILLDGNALASGQPFFQLGGYEISPDNRLLAYTEDTVGRRQYRLRVKDLTTGTLLPDVIENVGAGVAWAEDNRTLLYVEQDPVTLLGRRIRRHRLGDRGEHVLVYEEPDESFDLTVERSKSERYLLIASESTTSSEWRYARVDDPSFEFKVVVPREEDHEYQLDHLDEQFLIRTNWQALNFRIVEVPVEQAADRKQWRDVIAHDPEVFIQDFELFRTFVAVSERSQGLMNVRVQRWGEAPFHLTADDPAYTMALGSNPELDTTRLRYVYTSLTTPGTTYEYDLADGSRTVLKREPVLGDFDSANYVSEFVWAPARDGERIPVSIVYRKGTPLNGSAPLYQYGYGSYGLSMEPAFSTSRLSLLDRGFVYAMAHIRGGQELGRRWYDAGRLEQKWNTFNDFVDVTDYLVTRGYCARDKVFAAGGSAGGLLMGVIANVAPDRYAALVAHVPFVDIVTTMLDTSIPLTTLEYDEWGNPNEAAAYAYMLSYSPYDNIRHQHYPAMLVTTGLWDSQVQYYEPAKWVAKLRRHNTSSQPLLMHVNLEAGHGGKSGRYEHMREVAREYGFVIALAEGASIGEAS
ncbi:oligopeptidase B [Steroidobacter agaridevorans]|uniref:Oligopeptidase B n=1 Tax=Steroidobacter agaridevorans TaxID=2695856 RepID=A0A829Y4Q2_9GAMM|nr:S9 family peptidase [Steroidobacter agaridevorans]GFE78164.1 oligopeptidase B [Steroidobacter agaridevorans]